MDSIEHVFTLLKNVGGDKYESHQIFQALDSKIKLRLSQVNWFSIKFYLVFGMGSIFMIISIFYLEKVERFLHRVQSLEAYKKGKVWTWCQSCGKNFSATRIHSTNANGTTNFAFCTECYQAGNFTNLNLTREEVYAELYAFYTTVTDKKLKKKWNKQLTGRFKSLERWSNNPYREISVESYLNS